MTEVFAGLDATLLRLARVTARGKRSTREGGCRPVGERADLQQREEPIALEHELRDRRPEENFRRQSFAEQERLLRVLRGDWADHSLSGFGHLEGASLSDRGEPR